MAEELIVKKWGNSLAVVLPRELVKMKKIRENQKVILEVVKKADLSDIFGSRKIKTSTQKLKDTAREGWN
jgi:antitoxin component of MazEF toxin-antitoxin module